MGGNMRLRNKETGEIIDSACIGVFKHQSSGDCKRVDTEARSLSKFLEQWEDYKPAEPLIKDEKIRKAVRAWAEACGVNRVVNGEYDNELCAKGQQFYGAKIVLTKTVALPRGKTYTITELCGEEEE
jgi:hypothetical protein